MAACSGLVFNVSIHIFFRSNCIKMKTSSVELFCNREASQSQKQEREYMERWWEEAEGAVLWGVQIHCFPIHFLLYLFLQRQAGGHDDRIAGMEWKQTVAEGRAGHPKSQKWKGEARTEDEWMDETAGST